MVIISGNSGRPIFDIIKRCLPVLSWTKSYNPDKALADLVAGITIGLTLIPQCIAYASLAGLNPQYGLYSSLCGGLIYGIFGTIPQLNIAPTALLSLLTYSYTHNLAPNNVPAAVLLCFLSGLIELLCGLLHLGFLVDFVSMPVVAAFTSAGAITIASSQVKNLLGLRFSAENFISVWKCVFQHITETRKWDAILGLSCCIFLLLMRKLKDFGGAPSEGIAQTNLKKFLWFCSVARNIFVVIFSAVMAFLLEMYNIKPFSLTPQVPAGLPHVSFPIPTTNATFKEMTSQLGSGVLVVPFIAILGNVAIAKTFANGKTVEASQEMIAVGMCNIIGSFFGSYPVNASFSRGAVSSASGVKTPLAGIYTAVLVILALTFLTPYFPYIPKPTLASVIICAVIFMVEFALTKLIWKINRKDLIPFFVTLLFCLLLSIEVGILIGILVDVIFLLYAMARPKVLVEKNTYENVDYITIIPTSAILFPSAEYIRATIMKNNEKYQFKYVVIDCQRINKMDFTAGKCLSAFLNDFTKLHKTLIFYQAKKSVEDIIRKVCKSGVVLAHTEVELNMILEGHKELNNISKNEELIRIKQQTTTKL